MLSKPLQDTVKLFLYNKQCESLIPMQLSPGVSSECKILGAIVVHTATVLSTKPQHQSLLPFYNMFKNPKFLAVSLISIMMVMILSLFHL